MNIPAVGAVPLAHVLGKGDCGVAFDGDPVVIPDDDQVAQLLSSGQGGGLRGHAFLEIAVRSDHEHPVIERTRACRCIRIQ